MANELSVDKVSVTGETPVPTGLNIFNDTLVNVLKKANELNGWEQGGGNVLELSTRILSHSINIVTNREEFGGFDQGDFWKAMVYDSAAVEVAAKFGQIGSQAGYKYGSRFGIKGAIVGTIIFGALGSAAGYIYAGDLTNAEKEKIKSGEDIISVVWEKMQLGGNYVADNGAVLNTINKERAEWIYDTYLSTWEDHIITLKDDSDLLQSLIVVTDDGNAITLESVSGISTVDETNFGFGDGIIAKDVLEKVFNGNVELAYQTLEFSVKVLRALGKTMVAATDIDVKTSNDSYLNEGLDCTNTFKDARKTVIFWRDPLALDLNGDGIAMTSTTENYVQFDLDCDGRKERIGWVNTSDGFLAQAA